MARAAASPSGATIASDQADYAPGATVILTGTGWASGEVVHIFVNDSVGNTWSLDSGQNGADPDPVADTNGGFTYSFSLPNTFIANYASTATGATSGTATSTFTDSQCPSSATGNPPTDNQVGASFTTSGSTATYTFSSFKNETPSNGVPGLIEYCVYPTTHPTSAKAVAVGTDLSAWTALNSSGRFSYERPGGNPSNIPLNGKTGITMGTATWSSSVPSSQTILLHINDSAFCQPFDGQDSCFVLPGTPQQAQDLTVSKTATPSFTRTFKWGIAKSVDQSKVIDSSGSATFNYTVSVTHDSGTDSDWQVNGTITITNPNDFEDIVANVSDVIDNGGICTVSGGSNVTVPASKSESLSYTCTYASAPSANSGTNTATASWDQSAALTPDGSAHGTATYAFGAPTTSLNNKVTITDTFNGVTTTLGTLTATDATPFASATYKYSRTVSVPAFNCVKYTNSATIVETTQSASQTIEVCGPAKTGALTIGFWQNKNGQGIITSGASTGSVCSSGAWLRQYTPFQDLSATATCSQVATYVYNIIKAANASGSSMNAMLKAQMLATALDVYFSDSSLGGNKINAPASIGGTMIDLTKICQMIDGSSGTGTCGGNYENVSSAFGGAGSLTVSQMLSYAAIQSNVGGSTWYGNVKATQQLAKDAFDAINNQVAFAP